VNEEFVTGIYDVLGHARAHDPETDKTYFHPTIPLEPEF
jgi:hypothetical protein